MDGFLGGILGGASLVGLTVLFVLVLMSLGSWYVIILKLMTLNRAKRAILAEQRAFQDARDMASAMHALGKDSSSSLYRIAHNAVRELKRIEASKAEVKVKARLAKDNMRRALRQAVASEMSAMDSQMSFLGTCANATPYIGLLGTVWGIIVSFQSIATLKTAAISAVAPGMAEALIATAFGLAVAIPSTIAYNAIQGLLSKIETELVNFAGIFLNRIQREMPWIVAESD